MELNRAPCFEPVAYATAHPGGFKVFTACRHAVSRVVYLPVIAGQPVSRGIGSVRREPLERRALLSLLLPQDVIVLPYSKSK